jgi:hypothetical protein
MTYSCSRIGRNRGKQPKIAYANVSTKKDEKRSTIQSIKSWLTSGKCQSLRTICQLHFLQRERAQPTPWRNIDEMWTNLPHSLTIVPSSWFHRFFHYTIAAPYRAHYNAKAMRNLSRAWRRCTSRQQSSNHLPWRQSYPSLGRICGEFVVQDHRCKH